MDGGGDVGFVFFCFDVECCVLVWVFVVVYFLGFDELIVEGVWEGVVVGGV